MITFVVFLELAEENYVPVNKTWGCLWSTELTVWCKCNRLRNGQTGDHHLYSHITSREMDVHRTDHKAHVRQGVVMTMFWLYSGSKQSSYLVSGTYIKFKSQYLKLIGYQYLFSLSIHMYDITDLATIWQKPAISSSAVSRYSRNCS